jgi:hypothetical protein
LKLLIQAVGSALFQLAKGVNRQGHFGYGFRIEQWEKNGFLFTKIGNL